MLIYHPEPEQLLDYSAGSLHPSVSLCVSVHLEYCLHCRQQLAKLDCIGGSLLETLEPQPLNPSLLDSIWQRIDAQESTVAAVVKTDIRATGSIPSSVQKILGYNMDKLDWRRHGPKVGSAELLSHDGIKASLIRIAAGATIPAHDHTGNEYTVILEGSFSDASGVYQKGDFLLRKPGEKHSPTATTDMDCLCLAVLEAPLKFSNAIYEVFNRFNPL